MQTMSVTEMSEISGGKIPQGTMCGIAIGGAVLATAAFGLVGALLSVNKAAAVCAIDYLA